MQHTLLLHLGESETPALSGAGGVLAGAGRATLRLCGLLDRLENRAVVQVANPIDHEVVGSTLGRGARGHMAAKVCR